MQQSRWWAYGSAVRMSRVASDGFSLADADYPSPDEHRFHLRHSEMSQEIDGGPLYLPHPLKQVSRLRALILSLGRR